MTATRIEPVRIQSVFLHDSTYPGRLITVVGFDGSGKTTQIQALGRRFRAAGREVVGAHSHRRHGGCEGGHRRDVDAVRCRAGDGQPRVTTPR
jgi:ABC-type hemin transport system ATPase subunit